MAGLVLESKVESLRSCVARIQLKCPADAATLATDIDAQDIVVLNLSRAVQLCVDMAMHHIAQQERPTPQTMGEAFSELARMGTIDEALCTCMRSAVGFRNLAVHNYDAINWAIVFAIASEHLEDFRAFAKAMLAA